MDNEIGLRSRIRGCLLGGAIGDALGAPVEFMSRLEIERRFGAGGIAEYAPAFGRRGAISDDTQMTLFTAEGLIRAFVRESLKGICSVPAVVSHAYLRWLRTQGEVARSGLEIGTDGWLWKVRELHSRRAPGNTCLSSLISMDRYSVTRAHNDSKGAGAITRVAPVALAASEGGSTEARQVFELAKVVSWVTHGHPSGYLSAAAFAVILHALLHGLSMETGLERARGLLGSEVDSAETLEAIDRAVACAGGGVPAEEAIPRIGEGWVGEEALGIAIYCFLTTPDFDGAIRAGVNHDGDSDTTGSLAGQLAGAAHGEGAIPARWLEELELRETLTQIADDLSEFHSWGLDPYDDPSGFTDQVWERYPGW